MPIRIPTSDFFEGVGAGAQDFASQLADRIPRFACQLWQAYPSFLSKQRDPTTSYVRGYMNNMCAAIQPPVPAPASPFTGGQCPGVLYRVNVTVERFATNGSQVADSTYPNLNVPGAVRSVTVVKDAVPNSDFTVFVVGTNADGSDAVFTTNSGVGFSDVRVKTIAVSTMDGSPDVCGNPPADYPPAPSPLPGDLNTTINITNEDGLDLTLPLIWNQISPEFNFPISFDVGGINATLDIGGLTLDANVTLDFGGGTITRPVTDSDGNLVLVFADNGATIAPEPVQQETQPVLAEYVECQDGELTEVSTEVGVATGISDAYLLIIQLLKALLEETCKARVDLGLPEIYPVLPGADRPIIMYYFKEDLAGTKGRSTYVSSLPNPSLGAIAEIENVKVPDRQLGEYVASVRLLDGSRLIARGKDEGKALAFFNFLVSRVTPELVPPDLTNKTVITQNPGLQEVNVKCSQIEYYPDGKSFARNPSVLRVVKFE